MAPFRFKLQSILDLRAETEKSRAVGLVTARKQAESAQQARDDLAALRDVGRERLAGAHGAGGLVGHLQNLAYVVEQVDQKITVADEDCERANGEVVDSMKAYHRAFQARRTLDHLKGRRMKTWRVEQARIEQQTMDEVALSRFGRTRVAGAGGE